MAFLKLLMLYLFARLAAKWPAAIARDRSPRLLFNFITNEPYVFSVIPAKAGIQISFTNRIPVFTRMTNYRLTGVF